MFVIYASRNLNFTDYIIKSTIMKILNLSRTISRTG